jgi:hypothetical protein
MLKRIVIIFVALIALSAIASGAYLWKIRGNKPAIDKPAAKERAALPIGEEKDNNAIPKADPQVSPKPAVPLKTSELFRQASALVPGRLVRLTYRSMPLGEPRKNTRVLSFFFYNDGNGKTYEADYDMANRKFFKNPDPPALPANLEAIPESVISFGYEGARKLFLASQEYKDLVSKYPDIMRTCTDSLAKDQRFGWEWRSYCRSSAKDSKALILITANVESKKISVLRKENLGQ